ncbi:hypothetical protein BGZ82_005581 [Podila clonocystis]|nr:hypothetical protein BGZ82_005581 [Podila clonocystis]
MVSMAVKPTNIQDPRSFLTHDTELSGPSSEKQVISLTVATNNLALSTPTTSPVTAAGSTASLSRAKTPFPPFSEKVGQSLHNQVVSVGKPKQVAQQYLYKTQTIMNNGRTTSPPEPSTPFGGEVSEVGTSPSIVSAPPPSLSQSIQQQLQQRTLQREEDFMQQEAALNKLKDLFEQNDLNELGSSTSKHEAGQGPCRNVPRIQRHWDTPIYTLIRTTINNTESNKWRRSSAQEPLEALKTVSSLSLEALDHPFMMDTSQALFAPGSSASPPPSWLLESDLGVGLVDDPDDDEAENDTADDWSSTQADESGTTIKGVRRVGGRAVGGSRPNSSTSPKYECPLCNRFYTRPFNLRSHMLVHEDKKPFACELCDSRFTRRHDMVRHIKTRHKNQQQDVVGEGMDGGGPTPAAGTGPAAIPLQAQSQEERDGAVKNTLEILQ